MFLSFMHVAFFPLFVHVAFFVFFHFGHHFLVQFLLLLRISRPSMWPRILNDFLDNIRVAAL